MAVTVPRDVYEGLEDIRQSGETNMMDRKRVQSLANERGHYSLVTWLEDNRSRYAEGVFKGYEPEDE